MKKLPKTFSTSPMNSAEARGAFGATSIVRPSDCVGASGSSMRNELLRKANNRYEAQAPAMTRNKENIPHGANIVKSLIPRTQKATILGKESVGFASTRPNAFLDSSSEKERPSVSPHSNGLRRELPSQGKQSFASPTYTGNFVSSKLLGTTTADEKSSPEFSLPDTSSKTLADMRGCVNHPSKKAKYIVSGEEPNSEGSFYFCSKCAIKLASQGVKVNEMLSREETLRKAEISRFLDELGTVRNECAELGDAVGKSHRDFNAFFRRQSDQLQKIFGGLIASLEKQHKSLSLALGEEAARVTELFSAKIALVGTNISDLDNIREDVSNNMSNIIKNIEMQPFRNILSKYEEKLSFFRDAAAALRVERLETRRLTPSIFHALEELGGQLAMLCEFEPIESRLIKTRYLDAAVSARSTHIDKSSLNASFEGRGVSKSAKSKPSLDTTSMGLRIVKDGGNSGRRDMSSGGIGSDEERCGEKSRYVEVLEKVSANQAKTQYFYENVMKTALSPVPEDLAKKKSTRSLSEHRYSQAANSLEERELTQDFEVPESVEVQRSLGRKASTASNTTKSNARSKSSNNAEIKTNEQFVNFIERRITDEASAITSRTNSVNTFIKNLFTSN